MRRASGGHTSSPRLPRSAHTALLAMLALAACGGSRGANEPGPDPMTLYASRDYFGLRDLLEHAETRSTPELLLLRAVVAQAFNEPHRSNEHLDELLASDGVAALPDSLRVDALELRARNHLRLHEYPSALAAARQLLSRASVDSATREDIANLARIAEALTDVPPQRVVSRTATTIEPGPDGRIPVRAGGRTRDWVIDTGANLSTVMRSEADSLGWRVREAGIQVGTSTGSRVLADVAVAPRLALGDVVLENVVFLVVPDELLTFGDFRIPGIIGFPVFDALGEVEFRRGGVMAVPATVPQREARNLALDFLTPLIRVEVLGSPAVCDFDTGANTTSLHLPFYHRHRERIDAEGTADTVRFAGAGGERIMPARILADVRLAFGDTATVLSTVPVYMESVATAGQEHARDCRLGLDALAGFAGYLINLRSMTFLPL